MDKIEPPPFQGGFTDPIFQGWLYRLWSAVSGLLNGSNGGSSSGATDLYSIPEYWM